MSSKLPVIRLESGYENEVIWFPGPVAYEESNLSSDLIKNLQWWHRRIEGATTPSDHFGPFSGPMGIADAGHMFAAQLAEEVGQGFEIEFWFEGLCDTYRSSNPATNLAAERSFSSRIDSI